MLIGFVHAIHIFTSVLRNSLRNAACRKLPLHRWGATSHYIQTRMLDFSSDYCMHRYGSKYTPIDEITPVFFPKKNFIPQDLI